MRPLKNALFIKDDNERVPVEPAVSSVKSANAPTIKDDLKMITTQMDQNKLHNLQTKHELKEFRRKLEQTREKELTTKQKDLMISRLTIQVTERDKDLARLKTDYDQ
jgi:L-lactate utilization protein LutB